MLNSIRITDFALIDKLEIEFTDGLNVLTGSTGAGKSIIIGALIAGLGERASDELIRSKAKFATVEAVFTYPDYNNMLFENVSNSDDNHLIFRREIVKNGRSKAFINDKTVTLANLKSYGAALTDIIGQHRQRGLADNATQLEILDSFAGLVSRLDDFSEQYRKYVKKNEELRKLEVEANRSKDDRDLLEFQIKEIESAEILPEEDKILGQERQILLNAEKIKEICYTCLNWLNDEDGSAAERVQTSLKEIDKIARISEKAGDLQQSLTEVDLKLTDAADGIRELADSIEADRNRLEFIEERLALLSKLKRKYGESIEAITEYAEQAKEKLSRIDNFDNIITKLQTEIDGISKKLSEEAASISATRKKAANGLEKQIEKHLADLSMNGARFKVDFRTAETSSGPFKIEGKFLDGDQTGIDSIEYQICANPGEELKSLALTASGGELSRILLAICSALVESYPKETLVFDEIDSGISGEVALKVGEKLEKLASKRQVICITHLQQIAGCGKSHFKVYKGKSGGRSVTRVKLLEGEERIKEIARLLTGEKISEAAMKSAANLLKNTGQN